MNYMYMAGQAVGIAAMAFGLFCFQMKTARKLLTVQLIASILFVIHYLMIGGVSAAVLHGVCGVRNIVYQYIERKNISIRPYSILFAVIIALLGAVSWQGWYSVFVVLGLGINTVCMSFKNAQNIRKSILITAPLVIIYNIFVCSVGGIIHEGAEIVSSVIGLIRFNKR